MTEYEIYHDESQEGGYWHGLLFIPTAKKEILLKYLLDCRKICNYSFPITLKRVQRNGGLIYDCCNGWIQIGLFSLIQQNFKKELVYLGQKYENGEKINKEIIEINEQIGARLIIYQEKDNHKKIENYPDHCSKIETTFRFALKYGLNSLFSSDDDLHIKKIHFDGYEHHHRHIDRGRIVDRLGNLIPKCSFEDDLIDDRTGVHSAESCQDYNDCQLLQLTDLFVSGFRNVLSSCSNKYQWKISEPLYRLFTRKNSGGMHNSRWNKGFCLSSCYLDSGVWNFDNFKEEIKSAQKTLF